MKTFAFIATSLALAATALAEPISLFQDTNFSGPSITIDVTPQKCQDLPGGFQRSVSSIKLGTLQCGLCYDACVPGDNGPSGTCYTRFGDIAELDPNTNDRTVSVWCTPP